MSAAMTLAALRAALVFGPRSMGRGLGKFTGTLTAPLSGKAMQQPLVIGGQVGTPGSGSAYIAGELPTTYGAVSQITGPATHGAQQAADANAEQAEGGSLVDDALLVGLHGALPKFLTNPKRFADLFPKHSPMSAGRLALRSSGPLAALELATLGATEALSRTEVGQDLGIDEGMTFTEMNFQTGEKFGDALINFDIGMSGDSIAERQRSQIQRAEKEGNPMNPLNWLPGMETRTQAFLHGERDLVDIVADANAAPGAYLHAVGSGIIDAFKEPDASQTQRLA